MLFDNHNRPLNYLRLSVTDRCNLRCFYCMPSEGMNFLPQKNLLSFSEMMRLVQVLSELGITKIRITGGEPFMRKGLMDFLKELSQIPKIEEIHLTTNGVFTTSHIPELKAMGITSVNLSLDTLDPVRFKELTFRDNFKEVWHTFESLLSYDIPVKINAVVMKDQNMEDVIPLIRLTEKIPVSVRFIEEMPFNGEGIREPASILSYKELILYIQSHFPDFHRIPSPANSTAQIFQIPNHLGTVGIIPAYSRTFCGTCNRIRITANGILKTCLYDYGVLDLKDLLRNQISDSELTAQLLEKFKSRPKDGFEAERLRENNPIHESMSIIGG